MLWVDEIIIVWTSILNLKTTMYILFSRNNSEQNSFNTAENLIITSYCNEKFCFGIFFFIKKKMFLLIV